jgi:hypothetical protein
MYRALALAVLLSGCATNNSMTAEQISAATKDKSISVVCAKIIGPWGTAETTVVTFDQRVINNGGVNVGDKCAVAVTDTKSPTVPKP